MLSFYSFALQDLQWMPFLITLQISWDIFVIFEYQRSNPNGISWFMSIKSQLLLHFHITHSIDKCHNWSMTSLVLGEFYQFLNICAVFLKWPHPWCFYNFTVIIVSTLWKGLLHLTSKWEEKEEIAFSSSDQQPLAFAAISNWRWHMPMASSNRRFLVTFFLERDLTSATKRSLLVLGILQTKFIGYNQSFILLTPLMSFLP